VTNRANIERDFCARGLLLLNEPSISNGHHQRMSVSLVAGPRFGLPILFKVPAGIWGKPHPIDVGFRVDATFVWILRIRKSEWLRGSV
jgi:hypothetical protein